MLTTLQANFVREYKLTGNATEAVKRAGWKLTNPKSANVIGSRLLKNPKIKELVTRASVNQELAAIAPEVNYRLPSKQEYLAKAWKRTEKTENSTKEETQVKYTELVGKGLGYIGKEDTAERDPLMIICSELKLSLSGPMPQNIDALSDEMHALPTPPTVLNVSATPSTPSDASQEKSSSGC